MTEKNSLFPQLGPTVERRRALAKVYSLLIKLAEEAESQDATPTATKTEEAKTGDLKPGTDSSATI